MTFENSPYYKTPSLLKMKEPLIVGPAEELVINTIHCKGELSLIRNVIRENKWKETQKLGAGHILWYGQGLTETDRSIVKNRDCWYNRYVGAGFLSYKKQFS